tara:strand:+ start:21587 stop:22276 length:690 start_codon:yes stop_codon:yes gene_type:complete
MKLTSQQIQQLYKFTRQHYVEYYDVQTELVDHLANDIEQIWQEQPNLSFEQARDISFKKFGVFGFMDVLGARTSSLNKKYWKLALEFFKTFFKLPQLLTTLAIFCIIYSSFLIVPNHTWIYMFIGFGVFGVLIIRLFQLHKIKKIRFKKTNKKWLLEEYILNLGNIGAFAYFIIQIPLNMPAQIESIILMILVAIFFTCYIVLTYVISFVLPSKMEEIIEKQYPEYKLV